MNTKTKFAAVLTALTIAATFALPSNEARPVAAAGALPPV